MTLYEHEGRSIKVMVIEPKGIWAMVRNAAYPSAMPYVVAVRELVNVTPHNQGASVACQCESCYQARKGGLKAKA